MPVFTFKRCREQNGKTLETLACVILFHLTVDFPLTSYGAANCSPRLHCGALTTPPGLLWFCLWSSSTLNTFLVEHCEPGAKQSSSVRTFIISMSWSGQEKFTGNRACCAIVARQLCHNTPCDLPTLPSLVLLSPSRTCVCVIRDDGATAA